MKHNQMNEQDDLREYRFLRRRFLKDPLEKFIPQFLHWRKEKHLTLMQVSNGTGIPVKLLQSLEANQTHIHTWMFLKLCRFHKKKILIRLVDE